MLGNIGYRWTSAHPDLWRGRRYEVRCLEKLIHETEAEYGVLHADENYAEHHFEDFCVEVLLHLYVLPSGFHLSPDISRFNHLFPGEYIPRL